MRNGFPRQSDLAGVFIEVGSSTDQTVPVSFAPQRAGGGALVTHTTYLTVNIAQLSAMLRSYSESSAVYLTSL